MRKLEEIVESWAKKIPGVSILPISALNGINHEFVLQWILKNLPEGPPYFEKDQLTDKSERFFACEIIREKILLNYDKEIPYSVEVEVESFKREKKITRIAAVIYVARDELMETIPLWLKDYHLLLVYPDLHISTAHAYSSVKPQEPKINVRDVVQLPVEQWKDKLINDFEVSAFEIHPQLIKLKEELYNMGAEYACMSGSGSSFFGIFKEKVELSEEVKKYSNWWIEL